ncbi:MAG: C_GCAxxG_C_C family protein [Ruminococcus sp.]|nr:C_GCAxxG_C_C family protein [Ruminococcus sp.]
MGERAEKARSLFMEGYNCSQSVLGAFADLYGLDMNTAMRLSDGLGGGMGRMRLTCGAVSAMAIVAGLELSSGRPKDSDNRTEVYAKVREMSEKFAEKNGSVICAELLGSAVPGDNSSRPEARTAEYYKKRPCAECVYDCAAIIESLLLSDKTEE